MAGRAPLPDAAGARTPLPGRWRYVPPLALSAAIVALVAVIAYWGWYWLSPAPVHRTPPPIADPVATIVASGLLRDNGPVQSTDSPTLPGDARLLGTFAQSGGRGYALIRLASGPRMVAAGSNIVDGVALKSVATDGITIHDSSGEHVIALRNAAPLAPPAAAKASSTPAAARNAAPVRAASAQCLPPSGFSGIAVKLNAELLQGLLAQPSALKAIVEPADGGMSVRDDSGFATMLGLKRGDRVRLANGIPLANTDDVLAAVIKPLVANQQVRLSGTRSGAPQEMLLLNAGACP